jgi:chromosome segregation ATPase
MDIKDDAVQTPVGNDTNLDNTPVEGAVDDTNSAQSLAELQAEIERLRKHNETLLGEKKSTSQKAKDAEAEAKRLAEQKAKKDGDYETLLQAREAEKAEVEEKLTRLERSIAEKETALVASKVSGAIAVDSDAAELLNRFVNERLVHTDNQVVVLDANGNETNMTVEQLTTEFRNDKRYKYLVAGSGATGGGATGSQSSNGVTQNQNATLAKQKGDLTSYLKHSLSGVI